MKPKKQHKLKSTPKPGSQEAIDAGCKCPVLDNACGTGYLGMPGVYVMSANCSIHGYKLNKMEKE